MNIALGFSNSAAEFGFMQGFDFFFVSRNKLWPLVFMVRSFTLWDRVKKCHLCMLQPPRHTKVEISC